MADKPDCYKCKWRQTIPGDAHSACAHPIVADGIPGKLNIKGSPHGIKNGWFYWPFNFDPIWLENCDGMELKAEKEA